MTAVAWLSALGFLGFAVFIWLLRPKDRGAPYSPYFGQLNRLLQRERLAWPVMVVDLDRLDQNMQTLREDIGEKNLRLVVKSLPCLQLLQYLSTALGVQRFMVFHMPFLKQVFQAFRQGDFLFGKPMPIAAIAGFFDGLNSEDARRAQEQIQWLIDAPSRLESLLEFARERRLRLRVSLELDVGLHRGGLHTKEDLERCLLMIKDQPDFLRMAGFMGYEAHVLKAPKPWRLQHSFLQSQKTYQRFVDWAYSIAPGFFNEQLIMNGAGSPTFSLHSAATPVNELSVGSAFVKPSDFDLATLKPYSPAAFVATPVLKKLKGARLPFVEFLAPLWRLWDPNRQQSFFIYGGYWKAKPFQPAGLALNPLFGRSSNQEMLTGSQTTALGCDDFVFLRPTQSEAVLRDFGDLMVIRGPDRLVDRWPVLGS